jgi:hypothetical protein
VLVKYKITSKLSVFIIDNVELNNTVIHRILTKIRPDLPVSPRQARYLGYIINLIAKTFLFS